MLMEDVVKALQAKLLMSLESNNALAREKKTQFFSHTIKISLIFKGLQDRGSKKFVFIME